MAVLNILLLFVFLQNCQFFGLWIIKNWLKKFMKVEVDVKCMQTFCWRGLSGFRDFAPFCLPSNLVKFPFWTMDFSPWGQKYSMSGQRDMSELNLNATALQFFLKMYFNITLTSYNSWIHYTLNYAQPLLLPTKRMAKSGCSDWKRACPVNLWICEYRPGYIYTEVDVICMIMSTGKKITLILYSLDYYNRDYTYKEKYYYSFFRQAKIANAN